MPLFSEYENVVKIEEVKESHPIHNIFATEGTEAQRDLVIKKGKG